MIGTRTIVGLMTLASGAAFGQTPKFEVATVKKVDGAGPPGDIPRNLDTMGALFAGCGTRFQRFAQYRTLNPRQRRGLV